MSKRERVKQESRYNDDFRIGGPPKRERSPHRSRKQEVKKENDLPESKPKISYAPDTDEAPEPKQKADLGLSGALAEDTNTYKGVVIKYSEPDDAKKPKKRWRLYPFKGEESLPVLHIHRQSAFLIGKHRGIVDIPVDHPSISKQHAALQYRRKRYSRSDGSKGTTVAPYIIDLDSSNGTFLNGKKIEPRRYYELKEQDILKFAFSSRDYVVLLDNSAEQDENLKTVGDDGKSDQQVLDEFLASQSKKKLRK